MKDVIHILCVILSVACCLDTAVAECPDGWTVFQGSCYLFSHEKLTFNDAQHFCQRHGAHLVNIGNAVENAFIKSFVKDLKDADHWIGITDDVVEGIWKWVDTDTMATFTDWHPGQPDQGKRADCGMLWLNGGFQWGDNGCNELHQPICERRWEAETGPAVG